MQLLGELQDSAEMHQQIVQISLKKMLQVFRLAVGNNSTGIPKHHPTCYATLHTRLQTEPLLLLAVSTMLQAQSPEDSAALNRSKLSRE